MRSCHKPVLVVPVARRHAWFADEVAIDFPSLHSAVERMCESFLGSSEDGRRRLLSAEVRLSPREAFDGVTVPLDVPVRKVCRMCGGRGEVWSDPCPSCEGSGEALACHPIRLIVPPRVQHGDRFSLSFSAPSAPPTRVEVRVQIS